MTSQLPPDWEERYQQPGYWCGTEPVHFLRQHLEELPPGPVLDLAMGEGRNALFLARQGFAVTGIERSATAIAKAQARAQEEGLLLTTIEENLETYQLPVEQFDVVLCFYYLQRNLFGPMERTLRRGGALVVETYTVEQRQFPRGPRDSAHLLEPNELYHAFRHLRVAYYREVQREQRAFASLLAYRV